MAEALEARLAQLRCEIEDLRAQLRESVAREGGVTSSDRANSVSDQLDALILEFLRVRDQVGNANDG